MTKKQMKLGLFIMLPGQHVASWRHPAAQNDRIFDVDFITDIAKKAEAAKFDTIFFADVFNTAPSERTAGQLKIDPLIINAAVSAVTKNIGLIATATTSYNEPYHIARKFIGIDHLSKGRAGWNVVTSANPLESTLFGKEHHFTHAERYERAEEFVDVVKQLWSSVEKEALVHNQETGQYLDLSKVHEVNHEGKWFNVKGVLDAPESPQGHPVIVQAGSSEAGKELAAKTAEVIFTAWTNLEDAQKFYKDVKGRLAKYGRKPEDLKIMPGTFITVAKTEEEAIAKRAELNGYILPETGLKYLSNALGVDLTGYDVETPVSAITLPPHEDETNPQIRAKLILDLAERKQLKTLRELYENIAGARGHREIVGTPEQIADQLEEWFLNDAADGFNIQPPLFPDSVDDIINLVIPELQRRGLFRTEYEGTTLRENLGLDVPISLHKQPQQA